MILEFKKFTELFEHAQLTSKNENFVQNVGRIYVYGGGYNGNRREHGKPHFKLIKNDGEEIRILIPQVNLNNLNSQHLEILDEKKLDNKSKKLLLEWLKDDSERAKITNDEIKSNLLNVAVIWNTLNLDDENVEIIDIKVYK
jgi:hypothetical protein